MTQPGPKKLKKLHPQDTKSQPTRILYVEDAEVMRDTIFRLLEVYGYKVTYAKNGQEGVDMAIKWQPDLVLMDLHMPVMDGFKAIQEIRDNPQTQHLPIIVVSAWSGRKEREQARLAGANDYFDKPPDLDRLREAIDEAVASAKKPK
jgi:CheY-like chemotaxis protein